MKEFPESPPADEAPVELFERGHIWLHELVDGAPVRFQVQADGHLRFGDDVRPFGDDVPAAYSHVARHVREAFDREALRAAVDDVTSVVFFGVATHHCNVDYDWERVPNFLGSDVWSEGRGQYLNPDRVEKIYERLGLASLNTVRAELRAADFDPSSYAFPPSAWYEGPAAGVLVRNKTGQRARIENSGVADGDDRVDPPEDAAAFVDRYVTDALFEAVRRRLDAEGRAVTFDTLYQRVVEQLSRAHHRLLFKGPVDVRAVRSGVAERTGTFLANGD